MIDIYIKSYPNDFEFLYRCLESIDKFIYGYDNLIIEIPTDSYFNAPILPKRTRVVYCVEDGDGYLFQQYCKLQAFNHSKAEFIMYIDSDCIFTDTFNVNSRVLDSKPIVLYTDYNKVGDAICWKKPTEEFFGGKFDIEYEFMRTHPMVVRTDTLRNVCAFQDNLKKYILTRKNRLFSEFNVMFAFAFFYENEQYHFSNTENGMFMNIPIKQYWSWGGYTDTVKSEIDILLK